jgi:dihydroflavonol-4-reductase
LTPTRPDNPPDWTGRRVAITGATGFVGWHTAAALVRRGVAVTAVHRAGSDVSRLRAVGVTCRVAALTDEPALAQAFRGCEFLVHAAGAVDFGDDWARLRAVNVGGTRAVHAAARAAGVRRAVHVSSVVAVGGSESPRVLDETAAWDLGRFRVPYATTKREGEQAALAASGGGLEVVVVNPGCVVGPDDFTGSEFGTLCKRFWRGRVPVYFPGGSNFVDVRDVADGVLRAAARGRPGERYLLTGTNRTLRDFLGDLGRAAGWALPRVGLPAWLGVGLAEVGRWVRWVARREGRPYLTPGQARLLGLYFYFTCEKARRELGYEPRPLAESLADAHAFWNPRREAASPSARVAGWRIPIAGERPTRETAPPQSATQHSVETNDDRNPHGRPLPVLD